MQSFFASSFLPRSPPRSNTATTRGYNAAASSSPKKLRCATGRNCRSPGGVMPSAMSVARRSLCSGLGTVMLVLTAGSARAEDPQVTAMSGTPLLLLSGFDLAPFGYATEEFFVSGTATSYKLDGAPTADGKWNASPADT